ncbi:MAG: universal stress protein [Haloferacaceae archaeon]
MKRALAVVTQDERSKQVVREAAELAAGVGAKLLLLTVVPEEDYERKREAMEEAGSTTPYTLSQAEQSARHTARSVADEVLDEIDVDYELLGAVGRESSTILSIARDEEVDHIFIAGRRRSPTQKAIFGDITQRVLLNFNGTVTVLLTEEE